MSDGSLLLPQSRPEYLIQVQAKFLLLRAHAAFGGIEDAEQPAVALFHVDRGEESGAAIARRVRQPRYWSVEKATICSASRMASIVT